MVSVKWSSGAVLVIVVTPVTLKPGTFSVVGLKVNAELSTNLPPVPVYTTLPAVNVLSSIPALAVIIPTASIFATSS